MKKSNRLLRVLATAVLTAGSAASASVPALPGAT